MEFGEKLRTVCNESGIKLKEISDLTGIGYGTLKQYSQGTRKPKVEQIQKIVAIPRLEPWRELLLEQTELNAKESEFMILLARLRAQGREDEALAILRELEQRADD